MFDVHLVIQFMIWPNCWFCEIWQGIRMSTILFALDKKQNWCCWKDVWNCFSACTARFPPIAHTKIMITGCTIKFEKHVCFSTCTNKIIKLPDVICPILWLYLPDSLFLCGYTYLTSKSHWAADVVRKMQSHRFVSGPLPSGGTRVVPRPARAEVVLGEVGPGAADWRVPRINDGILINIRIDVHTWLWYIRIGVAWLSWHFRMNQLIYHISNRYQQYSAMSKRYLDSTRESRVPTSANRQSGKQPHGISGILYQKSYIILIWHSSTVLIRNATMVQKDFSTKTEYWLLAADM